jgi:hypothetical protein
MHLLIFIIRQLMGMPCNTPVLLQPRTTGLFIASYRDSMMNVMIMAEYVLRHTLPLSSRYDQR